MREPSLRTTCLLRSPRGPPRKVVPQSCILLLCSILLRSSVSAEQEQRQETFGMMPEQRLGHTAALPMCRCRAARQISCSAVDLAASTAQVPAAGVQCGCRAIGVQEHA